MVLKDMIHLRHEVKHYATVLFNDKIVVIE